MDAAADTYISRRLCLSQSLCCVLLRFPHYTIAVFLYLCLHLFMLRFLPRLLFKIFFSSLKQGMTISRR